MMTKTYEQYPRWIIMISNLNALAIDIIGTIIIFQTGTFRGISYIILILYLELRLLQKSCRNCRYYGKYCAFGKGRLSALIYPKGKPEKFINRKISRKDLIPDALVSLIPIITGIVLLTNGFRRWILISIILIIVLATQGNNCVRSRLACKHCKQGGLCCPAKEFFNTMKK